MKRDVELYMYIKSLTKIVNGLEQELELNQKQVKELERKQQKQQKIIIGLIITVIISFIGIGVSLWLELLRENIVV